MSCLGIDYGTTTTVAAICTNGQREVLSTEDGNQIIPSVVAFTPLGKVVVGKPARARRLIDPQNAVFSIKRILGRGWDSVETRKFRDAYPFDISRSASGEPQLETRSGLVTPVDILTHQLKNVLALPKLNQMPPKRVVVTVPASAAKGQLGATLAGAANAGLASPTLITEPEAAALAYFSDKAGMQTLVVYDLGGGTFDIAVLRQRGQELDVLAVGGEPYLGGDDVDRACAEYVTAEILKEHRWDVRTRLQSYETLVYLCEQAKITLSIAEETTINLAAVDPVLEGKRVTLTRQQVDAICMDLVRRTFVSCDETLARAGVGVRNVEHVILAGGATYMPIVRKGVASYFGQEPVADLPPDQVVALGAAAHAARL